MMTPAEQAAPIRVTINAWKHDGGCMIFLPSGVCTCEPADPTTVLDVLDAVVARCEQAEAERDDVSKRVSRRLYDAAEMRAITAEERAERLAAALLEIASFSTHDGPVDWRQLDDVARAALAEEES